MLKAIKVSQTQLGLSQVARTYIEIGCLRIITSADLLKLLHDKGGKKAEQPNLIPIRATSLIRILIQIFMCLKKVYKYRF